MEDNIKEGFICPICRKELDSLAGLQGHFENAHSSEDKAGLRAVKGLFGRAKRKLLGDLASSNNETVVGDSEEVSRLRSGSEASGIDPVLWEPQEFGATRDHFQRFKGLREDNVKRTVIETNKKVIRLEKLYDGLMKNRAEFKSEKKKRKAFEQTVVTWMADSMASRCPFCESNFNVRRRKHHCRLCGQIICADCSEFIAMPFAESLTKAAKGESQRAPMGEEMETDPNTDIRTCFACFGLLLRRSQRLQDKYKRSPLVQLYEKMTSSMEEASSLQPRYLVMADSLNAGEQTHSLAVAQETRHRLIKMFEIVDAASKRIFAMVQPPPQQQQQQQQKGKGKNVEKQQDQRPTATPRQMHVHKQIRQFASAFLQEHMVTLPGLPDADKLKRLQAERSRAAEEKARRDREAAERAMEMREMEKIASELQTMSTSTDGTPSSSSQVPSKESKPNSPSGWQPKVTPIVSGADPDQDPLLLQRDLLRGYIEQARKAKRFDEVETLQSSLRDIEMEISRSQR
ncbi:rabenosyn-5-like [Sycon ciliatum]|uniref:rabenosyn-5-like n=1 Tax=Sycon ciliatum TaxID=27933 RepID=UPI0020AB8C32|eukprot:scpid50666/ scgid34745/ Rabenosyn-5; 110 kDa protein; FYVE finger-containing Rab5 effector protein rabenosyn-5; Zinc finger FYVE domain-containing protein 20